MRVELETKVKLVQAEPPMVAVVAESKSLPEIVIAVAPEGTPLLGERLVIRGETLAALSSGASISPTTQDVRPITSNVNNNNFSIAPKIRSNSSSISVLSGRKLSLFTIIED